MKRNRKGLSFESQQTAKNKNKVFLAVTLVCFSLIIGSLSFLMLLRYYDYDLGNIVKQTKTDTTTESDVSETQQQVLMGKASFLFAHISEDRKEIRSIFYIKVEPQSQSIKVLPISPLENVSQNGKIETMLKSFTSLGVQGIKTAAEAFVGDTADRYVIMTDTNVLNALKYLGDLSYTQKEKLKYKTDELVLDIPKGEQLLSPDTVLRLAKYNTIIYKGESSNKNALLLPFAVKSYFNDKFAKNSESYFSTLINYTESDITAVDFMNAKSSLEHFAQSDDIIKIEVVDSLIKEGTSQNSTAEGGK
ncbi:MAG TPA: hypothetical protein VFC76_00215 [Oscillospiraceae bacterium]|nr:hypothetical protein [Oscillospiraceae bacterium]